MLKRIPAFRLACLPLILLIGACGGGGNGNNAPEPPPPTGIDLQGNGQLGIIVGGVVSIQNINGVELISTVTDEAGDYGPVTLPASHTGPVIIEITPANDGSSFYVCDFPAGCPHPEDGSIVAFGGQVPYTSTLSAVLPDESSINTANINPITTAIRARAESLGLSAETINQADREMAEALTELLGVEIPPQITTLPHVDLVNAETDAGDDPDMVAAGLNLSVLNAGLIALVTSDDESGPGTIDDVIDGLSTTFAETGEFGVSEEFNSGEVQSGELLFAMEQQIMSLAEEQPETTELIQELAPDNDLDTIASSLAETRNEIAPVPPVISGTPATTVAEDDEFLFTPTADDPDGDTLVFSITNQPAWASFDSTTGSLTGIPDNSAVGTTTGIVITVTDGTSSVSLPAFDITVTNTNDAPVISGVPATTVNEDTLYSFAPAASDVDAGDSISFSVTNAPSFLSLDTATGVLSGTPGNDDVGVYQGITISVTDGEVTSSLAPFDLTVVNVNDAPVISGTPPVSVLQDALYAFMPAASDVDSPVLAFSATGLPAWASLDTVSGAITGTPGNDDVGTTGPIVISVSDGELISSLPPFSIEVQNVNDAPSLSGSPATSVQEDSAYSFTPVAADIDAGDTLTFTATNLPSWLTLDPASGVLSGTPKDNHVGIYSGIVLTVTDSGGLTASLPAFNITVINIGPVISGSPPSTALEDAFYQFTPSASGGINFTIQNKPSWLSFNSSNGALSGTPGNSDVGFYGNISISISDANGSSTLGPFNIQVINVNDAPVITGTPAATVAQDSLYSFTPTATDIDPGEVLTFSIQNKPAWAAFNTTTGTLSGTPADADVEAYLNVTISVSDGEAVASLPPYTLTVTNVNDPPTISGTPATSATEDVAYTFTPVADDIDLDTGDVLTFSINKVMATDLPWATFSMTTGELAGTPGNSDVGTVNNIVITVTDTAGSSAVLPGYDLTIVNEPLVISGTPATVIAEDDVYSFTPTVVDQEDIQSFSITGLPSWATFDTSTGLLTGTPLNADVGTDTGISISVTDGNETSTLASFDITITNVNDPPVISGSPPTNTLKDILFSFTPTVVDVDFDPNPDTLTFSITNQPAWAVVNFDTATGQLSGTPDATDLGDYNNIGITVDDGMAQDTLTFSISVVEGEKVMVSWTPPTTRANGQSITTADLLGYELEYFESATPSVKTVVGTDVLDNTTTSYTTGFLTIGTWHFTVRAIENTGFEGDFSTEAQVMVDGVPG